MHSHTQKMRFLICLFFVCCRFALAKNATTTTSARECTFYLIDPELDQFDENSRWRGGKHLREGSKKSFKYDLFDFSEQDLTWNGTTIHLIAKNPTKDSASWVAGVVGNKTHKKQKFAVSFVFCLFDFIHLKQHNANNLFTCCFIWVFCFVGGRHCFVQSRPSHQTVHCAAKNL